MALYSPDTRTRRENVYLVVNVRGLNQALSKQRIKGHTLAEKIRSYTIEAKADDGNIPGSRAAAEAVDQKRFPVLWPAEEM